MGTLKIIRNTSADASYLYHALRYIWDERALTLEARGVSLDAERAFEEMMKVKRYFGKVSGNPLIHMVVSFDNRKVHEEGSAIYQARNIASYYADKYQVAWCVHMKGQKRRSGQCASLFHAHIILNSVSFLDGRMFAENHSDLNAFLGFLKDMTHDERWNVVYESYLRNTARK